MTNRWSLAFTPPWARRLIRLVEELHRRQEIMMAAIDDQLALVDAETTRIADWLANNLPNDAETQAKFAPVLDHLRAIAVDPAAPVPSPSPVQ
jgi:hypothetical protein